MRIVLVGARADGQAHVVLEAVEEGDDHEIVGFLDDTPGLEGTEVLGRPVLGGTTDAAAARAAGAEGFLVSIGSGRARLLLAAPLEAAGLVPAVVVHPRGYVAPSATVGGGTFVGALAVVSTGARVGRHALVPPGSFVSHHVEVGDGASLSPGAKLAGRSKLGDRAFLGAGVTVIPERVVGADAVVGAGAVVTRDIPPGVTAVGIPARVREPAE